MDKVARIAADAVLRSVVVPTRYGFVIAGDVASAPGILVRG